MADPRARFILSAEDRASGVIRKLKSETSSLGKAFAGLNPAIGGLVGGGALALFVKSSIDAADHIGKLSTRLGASTEALSQYKYVAELAGVSFNTLTMGWQRMTRRISEASVGMGEARGALKELGLSAQALNQLAPDKQFEALADAIMGVKNPADQVRLAMKLFDSEGVALLQTMKGGSEEMRKFRDEADKLGLTIDQGMADSAANAKDAMAQLGGAAQGLGLALGDFLSPVIVGVSNALTIFAELLSNGARDAERFARALGILDAPFTRLNKLQEGKLKFEQALQREYAKTNNMPTSRTEELDKTIAAYDEQIKLIKETIKLKMDLLGGDNTVSAPPPIVIDVRGGREGPDDTTIGKWRKYAETLTGKFEPAAQKASDQLAKLQELIKFQKENNLELISEDIIAEAEFDILSRMDDEIRELKGHSEELKDEWADLGPVFQSAFEDAIVEGKKLSDVLKGLEQDIIRIITRKTITEPLAGAVGGINFGSLLDDVLGMFSSGPSAANVSGPFAEGGIASGPTSGYLANLHGTEAVVPLSGGRAIPVELSGAAGGSVTVNVINRADNTQASTRERNEGGNRIIDVMIEQVKSGIANDIARGSGAIPGALSSTYGLNRVAGAY